MIIIQLITPGLIATLLLTQVYQMHQQYQLILQIAKLIYRFYTDVQILQQQTFKCQYQALHCKCVMAPYLVVIIQREICVQALVIMNVVVYQQVLRSEHVEIL